MTALEHALETARLVQILKQTIERRLPPDAVIDDAVTAIECEVLLLASSLKTEKRRM